MDCDFRIPAEKVDYQALKREFSWSERKIHFEFFYNLWYSNHVMTLLILLMSSYPALFYQDTFMIYFKIAGFYWKWVGLELYAYTSRTSHQPSRLSIRSVDDIEINIVCLSRIIAGTACLQRQSISMTDEADRKLKTLTFDTRTTKYLFVDRHGQRLRMVSIVVYPPSSTSLKKSTNKIRPARELWHLCF